MPSQLGSDLGNLKRLVERSRQTRRWETTAFSTSGGGTLHVPRQKSRGVPTTGGGEGLSIGTPPIGEIIRLGIDSHLGNGNEPVLFNSIAYRNGFNKAVVPSSQIELPHGAVYGIEGQLRWTDGFTGGGVVTLLLGNSVYMTLPGFNSAWTRFFIATEFDAIQGQRLSIFVDHDDTDADHDLQGELVIATKEPLKEVVTEGWIQIASVGPVGITQDSDGNWWGTEGGSGATVTKYDPNWSMLSSFESHADVRGIAYDGSHLWIMQATTQTVRRYTTAGVVDSSFTIGSSTPNDGIAYDGTDLWILSDGSNDVRRYSTTGTHLQTFGLPASDWNDITYHNGELFLANGTEQRIDIYDTSGNFLRSISTSGFFNFPTGVYVDSSETLYSTRQFESVWRWTGGIT